MGSPVFTGLPNVTAPWASPLEVAPPEGVEASVLLKTSPASWLNTRGEIEPDFKRYPETGFGPAGPTGAQVVGVSLTGRFPSYYAARPSPLFEGAGDEKGDAQGDAQADRTGRTLKESLPDARLVVLGASDMVSDLMLQLSAQPGGEVHRSNLQLVQNLIDWSVEDTDLLAIRSSGAFARTLRPVSEDEARAYEAGTVALSAGMLGVATLLPARRRRRVRPLVVPAGKTSGAAS